MDGRITMDTSAAVPTVVKRAVGTVQRSRLAHEAATLAGLQHPGVVRLVEYRTGDDHDELVTEFAGAGTLADVRPADVAAVAGIGAAIADSIADLHDAGVAHGALQADHVILGARHRPVLCSLSVSLSDPDAADADVEALARLVGELVHAVPNPRGGSERRGRAVVAQTVAAATSGELSAREVARRLAAVPGASLEAADAAGASSRDPGSGPDPSGTRTWRHRVVPDDPPVTVTRRARVIVVGLVVAVVIAVLVASGLQRGDDVEELLLGVSTPTPTPTPARTSTAGPVAPSSPEPAATSRPSCPTGLDVDGDGCADDTEVIGRLIRHGDTWYEVGEPGDVVVLGHWECAPFATPAVLRPATGEIFVFGRWPAPQEPLTVTPSRTVSDGASELTVTAVEGCDVPVAVPQS